MKIVITQLRENQFCADRPELPGSPICGYGTTWKEAAGDLFIQAGKDFGIDKITVLDHLGNPYDFKAK